MKSLAIDSASSCMVIAAKNEDLTATISLDIGMKQSQKILPAIDYVLSQVDMKASDLEYMSLCSGPGTFTGLRLAYSALKAIELANDIPLYGIPSLDVYAHPFEKFEELVVSVIDAKKDQFFAAIYENGNQIFDMEDTTAEKVADFLKDKNKKILVVGPDSEIFANELSKINDKLEINAIKFQPNATDSLFDMTKQMIEQKKEPLKDYDGPIYLRKSEAEIALDKK